MHYKIFKFILLLIIFNCFCPKIWSQADTPPQINATGNSFFCPTTEQVIVDTFTISDPDNVGIVTLFIQISEGYVSSQDRLKLNGSHPTVTDTFKISEGKLTLTSSKTGKEALNDLIEATKDVVFYSSNDVSGEKKFSFTINDKNYLPSTGHYYEYINAPGITWTDARDVTKILNYYGLQGYLATLTTAEEAQLAGEQAEGEGWIGCSDAETENEWKWVTGPEAGTIFWNGLSNGSAVPGMYENWAYGEPNDWEFDDKPKEENYGHVYENGKWNDYPNSHSAIKGYIVEYGSMIGDPIVNFGNNETTLTVAEILDTINDERCGAGEVTLSANSSDAGILWFDSETSTTPISSNNTYTPTILATTTFYVTPKSCSSGKRTPVTATINPLPDIKKSILIKNCDEDGNPDGFTNFNLSKTLEKINNTDVNYNISFHYSKEDANTGANAFNPDSFNNKNATNNTVYARVENDLGCYEILTITLAVSTTSMPSGFMETLTVCDNDGNNDGFHAFDLTEATTKILAKLPTQTLSVHYFKSEEDALLKKNEILPQTNYINKNANSETLFIRIENSENGNCYGIGEYLTLVVNPLPEFEVNTLEIICLDNFSPITLETFNSLDTYSFIWTNNKNEIIGTNNAIEVLTSGIYTVTATSNLGCESLPRTSVVEESKIATITLDDISIVDDSNNNSITINDFNNNLGEYDYEYSLNNEFGPFQDEPFFDNVQAGIHTLYVRDTNNCGTAALEVSIIGYPKFFTPNNDGENDTWNIIGINSDFYPTSSLTIFDRYGKLITEINPMLESWNGLYNGKELPSTDYWFSVELKDNTGKIRRKQGHFSLIRK